MSVVDKCPEVAKYNMKRPYKRLLASFPSLPLITLKYCTQSKTGGGDDLGTRLPSIHCLNTSAAFAQYNHLNTSATHCVYKY